MKSRTGTRPVATQASLPCRISARTIRSRLLLLVCTCTIPFFIFEFGEIYIDYVSELHRVESRAQDNAHNIASLVQRDLEARLAILRTLALSRQLQFGDLDDFRSQAERFLQQEPLGANVVLLMADGQQVLNTALPRGAPLPTRFDPTSARQLFATARPSVSDVFSGSWTTRPIVALEVPVMRGDGTVAYDLALNPTLDAFDDILDRRLPPGWIVSLIDSRGVIIARRPEGQRFVGTQGAADYVARALSASEGVLNTRSVDGTEVVAAFARVPGFQWTVGIGVPRWTLRARAWYSALATGVLAVILLSVAMTLAHVLGQQIRRPIQALRHLAAKIDEDGPPASMSTGLIETDEVALALTTAAADRKTAEQARERDAARVRLMVDELNHRVKNTLVSVQGIISQSLKVIDPVTRRTLDSRIRALAAAHDVLTRETWTGASLHEVVEVAIEPFGGAASGRFVISGPLLRLQPRAAVAIAIGLHELGTNALKYGALSNASGNVAITWSVSEDDPPRFCFAWKERGGPAVIPPSTLGFGSRLIQRGLSGYLDATAHLTFPPEGLGCVVEAPVSEVIAQDGEPLPQVGTI